MNLTIGTPKPEPYPMSSARDVQATDGVGWIFEPSRAVLLVHDMQRYFLRYFEEQEPLPELVHNVVRLIAAARRAGMPVAYTAQPGGMSARERGLLQHFWGAGMSRTPQDRDIVPQVAPEPGERVFTKWRYSGFVHSGLESYLTELGRDQLVVCGVYAHVGCLMTACDAFSRDIEPFLVADAIADFSVDLHRLALEYATARCAATVTTDLITEVASVDTRSR